MRLQRIAAVGTGAAALAAAFLTAPAATAAPSKGDLQLVRTRTSLLATHTWYQQTFHGLPVLGGYYVEHRDHAGHVTVDDGRLAVPSDLRTAPAVTAASAEGTAERSMASAAARMADPKDKWHRVAAAPTSEHASLAVLGGPGARLVWRVTGTGASGSSESVVDARTGAVLSQRSLVKNESGRGQVFNPNPVVALHDESLTDKNDANQAALDPAYKRVRLHDLKGNGRLEGRYVQIMNANQATNANNTFIYQRHDDRFEQVSAYFNITKAQEYLRSLGFKDVNNEAQKVFTDTVPDDNSWYDPSDDTITYGNGGVDDAEDQEVVWHELGHAIQDDQVPGFGSTEEGGAIGEGFGDYWAVTMSQPVSKGFDLPCVMDWDSTSYTSGPSHCLRRTDGTKTTADMDGEVHDDGEIWSRALWDIHQGLGRKEADTVIIESQFSYSPDTDFASAARRVVQTARTMYGSAAASVCQKAFADRNIL